MSEKIKILCVVGPTASGKTGLSIELAKALDGEIISADSMQIYKGLSIASAAPTSEEMQGIPHHLIEFLDTNDAFTVADYTALARQKISEVAARGKTPIIVGGTGLYINSLVDNIEFIGQETDNTVRERLTNEYKSLGGEAMLEKLREIDPDAAATLHPNNDRRIIRALEIYELTGRTLTQQNILSRQNESPYDPIMIGLNYTDRATLYERINRRVDLMLENGLLDEARAAFERRTKATDGAVQAIGHKEFFDFFEGNITLDEAVELLKRSTRRYAKRQLTWFLRDERINWIYPDVTPDVTAMAIKIIKEEI